MKNEEVNKIAEAIAAKIGEGDADQLLGCGSASNESSYHACNGTGMYSCNTYECGGAADFTCGYSTFACNVFRCYGGLFNCTGHFECAGNYSEP